jgi:hypothetical protein
MNSIGRDGWTRGTRRYPNMLWPSFLVWLSGQAAAHAADTVTRDTPHVDRTSLHETAALPGAAA